MLSKMAELADAARSDDGGVAGPSGNAGDGSETAPGEDEIGGPASKPDDLAEPSITFSVPGVAATSSAPPQPSPTLATRLAAPSQPSTTPPTSPTAATSLYVPLQPSTKPADGPSDATLQASTSDGAGKSTSGIAAAGEIFYDRMNVILSLYDDVPSFDLFMPGELDILDGLVACVETSEADHTSLASPT